MTNEEIFEKAMEQAKEHSRKYGLEIGTIVAHSSRVDSMKLLRIDGETGIVLIHSRFSRTGEEEEMEFPLKELFDVNLIDHFAQKLVVNRALVSLTRHFQN